MTEAASRHYIPALGNIYSVVDEYAEAILRIALGGILIPHGMQKLFGAFGGMGFAGNVALFDRIGFTPGIFWGTLVGCTELIGSIMLVLGLFTRFAAAARGRSTARSGENCKRKVVGQALHNSSRSLPIDVGGAQRAPTGRCRPLCTLHRGR
jgi:hypothetical protein